MRRPVTLALICLVGCLFVIGRREAHSAEGADAYRLGPVALARSGRDAFLGGLGAFDVKDRRSARSGAANLEYRFGRKLFVIGPSLGLVANLEGGLYGYFGLYADISLGPVVISPQVAAGGYSRGDSEDLGGVFEFRETIDLSYRFDGGSRLGVRLAHISNAGLYDENPGLEEAYVVYSIPLGPLL
jgi:lipid A 3-O-deacylase